MGTLLSRRRPTRLGEAENYDTTEAYTRNDGEMVKSEYVHSCLICIQECTKVLVVSSYKGCASKN
jgi:hypothetical protein